MVGSRKKLYRGCPKDKVCVLGEGQPVSTQPARGLSEWGLLWGLTRLNLVHFSRKIGHMVTEDDLY